MRDLEVGLALTQVDLPHAAGEIRLHNRIGIERDDRAVGQRDIPMLAHGGR